MKSQKETTCLNFCLVALLVAFMGLACQKTPQQLWETSGHADSTSLAFRDWDNAADPNATVQAACASCHSTVGFQEYLTTNNRTIQNPPLATSNMGITCDACHSDSKKGTLREPPVAGTVHFTASGLDATGIGTSAVICGQCHQGRAYEGSVDTAISKAGDPTQLDVILPNISASALNPHYRAAFAAIKASKSQIGYTYGNPALHIDSTHAGGTDCMFCHNQHSSAVDVGASGKNCSACHSLFITADAVLATNVVIPGLETQLLAVIKAYAKATQSSTDNPIVGNITKAQACIAYDDATYPYWFNDANCDGTADTTAYASFTPRLAKACYNYMVSKKDPGGFAHNGGYISSLLTASIVNLRVFDPNLGK